MKEQILEASDGKNYKVTVTYDSTSGIPEDAELYVSEIKEGEAGYENYVAQSAAALAEKPENLAFARAFDITLKNPQTGEEYQPNKDVTVNIELLDDSLDKYASVDVVHIPDKAGEEAQVMDSTVHGESVEFETDGFSVYVLIPHEGDTTVENARVEFHFLSQDFHDKSEDGYGVLASDEYEAGFYSFINKGGTYQTSQVLKDGEALEMIANPPNIKVDGKDKYFFGWYPVVKTTNVPVTEGDIVYKWPEDPKQIDFEKKMTLKSSNGSSLDNVEVKVGDTVKWDINGISGTAVIDAEGTGHVYLAPIYEDYYFVNFRFGARDSDLWGTIMLRKLIVLGEDGLAIVRIGDQIAPSADATHQVFAGWETVTTKKEQKKEGGVLVWLVHNDATNEDEEVVSSTQPEGSVAVMIDVPDESKETFDSVDPVTGEEKIKTVYASDGSSYEQAMSDGYYIVIREDDLAGNSLDLYPLFAEARWIRFDTGRGKGNGATYTPSQYLLTSDRIQGEGYNSPYYVTKLPAGDQPLRNGYEFKGWYADALTDSKGDIANLNDEMDVSFVRPDGTTFVEHLQAKQITDGTGAFVTGDYQKKINDGGEKLIYEIKDGKLYVYEEMESLTLYALWEEVSTTKYSVLVWKQKVTDDVYATEVEKTYDYSAVDSRINISGTTGQTLAQLRTERALAAYEEKTITGFHCNTAKTNMSTDVKNDAGETVTLGKLSGDGTTVINVYFDRNAHTLKFSTGNGYNSNDNSNRWNSYPYTLTIGSSTPQYAFVATPNGGEVVELTKEGDNWYIPKKDFVFVEDDVNGIYGKVGDKYYLLSPVTVETTTYTADYRYTQTESFYGTQYGIDSDNEYQPLQRRDYLFTPYSGTPTSGTYYGWYNNDFITLYYNNGTWYRTRVRLMGVYTYSNEYTGVFYSRSDPYYAYYYYLGPDYYATRYTRENDGTTDVTSNATLNTTELYYIDSNGGEVTVTPHTTSVSTGEYTYVDDSGKKQKYTGEHRYSSVYQEVGTQIYNGDRYTRSDKTNNAHLVYVIEALYGQNISKHFPIPDMPEGCRWMPQSDSVWSQVLAYIDNMPDRDVSFLLDISTNSIKYLHYYVEALPGRTSETTYNQKGFVEYTTIAAKYGYFTEAEDYITIEGFSKSSDYPPVAYDKDNNRVNGIWRNSNAINIYCYYLRNNEKLTYKPNYPNVSGLTFVDSDGRSGDHDETIPYEESLKGYKDIYIPNAPDHYHFTGWYEDSACTVDFNFESTMPAGDKIIYAGWEAERLQINIDPNGGEIDHVDHRYENESDDLSKKGYRRWWWDSNGDAKEYTIKNPSGSGYIVNPEFNETWKPFATFNRVGDSGYVSDQATYINANYNATITEYPMDGKRQYVEITDAEAENLGTGNWYYYLNTQYSADTDGTPGLPSDLRNALYITEAEIDEYYNFYVDWIRGNILGGYISGTITLGKQAWKDKYLAKRNNGEFKKYRKLYGTEAYTFLGWYKLDSNGNPETMPYNFADTVKGGFTLRAYWRLDGGYRILYTPEYKMDDGTVINGKMDAWTDPQVATASYADGAATNIYRQPTGITANNSEEEGQNYIFRGWRLVSVRTVDGELVYTPLENNVFYDPGDPFTVSAGYADRNSLIYFQAVYEKKENAYRRPEVVALTLDANSGFLTTDGTSNPTEGGTTLDWTNGGKIYLDYSTEEMIFGYRNDPMDDHFQTGNTVHLYQYATDLQYPNGVTAYKKDGDGNDIEDEDKKLKPVGKNYFKHPSGHVLLGFDDRADEDDFVATYPADSVISVQRTDDKTIYAVWEPMVYLNIVNNTKNTDAGSEGGDLYISLSPANQNDDTALYVVNEKTGLYDRELISDINDILVAEGKTLKLAIPYGKDKQIKVTGTNNLGTGILLYWQGELNGVTEGHSKGEAKNHESFEAAETLVEDEKGITITFHSLKADYTLVQDENWSGGYISEAYFSSKATDSNYVENSYTLPSPSTRLGYEFLGWAETKEKADAGTADYPVPTTENPGSMTISNMKTKIFDRLDSDNDQIVTIYAVWKAKAEASTVLIYKDVQDAPESVRQNKEFEFTLNCTAEFKQSNTSNPVEKSYTAATYTLKDDQYLKIVTIFDKGLANSEATLTTSVKKYQVNETGEDTLIEQDPPYPDLSLTWENDDRGNGSLSSFNMSVAEKDYSASPDYFNTDLELAASTQLPLTKDSIRQVHWEDTFTGGTVIFTNTRQTVDVNVKKILEGRNVAAGFNFGVSYVSDGETTTREDITVTSGSDEGTDIKKIPVGAELTITEKGTDLLDYDTTVVKNDATGTLDVTSSEETTGTSTMYKRAVTITVTEATELTFTNTLKSVPVKIVKIGYDGTGTYTDVEAQFTMSHETSNVFTGRYTRPVSTTVPRGNIIFETGQSYSGTTIDPVLYVGDYTLTETKLWGDYICLDRETEISVKGTKDGTEVTVTGTSSTVEKVENVWVITVINRKVVNMTVQAGLLDPMVDQRNFKYSGTYKLGDNEYDLEGNLIKDGITPAIFELTAPSTSDGSVSPASTKKTLHIPIGATNLTITEDTSVITVGTQTIGETYDIKYDVKNGTNSIVDTTTGHEVKYSEIIYNGVNRSPIKQEYHEDTLTFINKRKTVNVTISKTVISNDISGSFEMEFAVKRGNVVISNYKVFDDTTEANNDLVTDSNGIVTFTLEHDGNKKVQIPVGADVVVSETQVHKVIDGQTVTKTPSDAGYAVFMTMPGVKLELVNGKADTVKLIGPTEDKDIYVFNIPSICKVTDEDGNLLYVLQEPDDPDTTQDESIYIPAIFPTIQGAFEGRKYSESSDLKIGGLGNYYQKIDNGDYGLYSATKQHRIEMLVDYPVPNDDVVTVNDGNDMVFTTASKNATDGYPFRRSGEYTGTLPSSVSSSVSDGKAVLTRAPNSKDQNGNIIKDDAFFTVGDTTNSTTFTMSDLIIDGAGAVLKDSVRGGCLTAYNSKVTIDNCVIYRFEAAQGGAVYTTGVSLTVADSLFDTCKSGLAGDGNGGGGINTTVDTLTISGSTFRKCTAVHQAGAVYQVGTGEKTMNLTNCDFVECASRSAGGVQADVRYVNVTGCNFIRCVATANDSQAGGNGGGLNNYYKQADNSSKVTVTNCTFQGCSGKLSTGNKGDCLGGGMRSAAKTTELTNCTFTDDDSNPAVHCSSAKFGGGAAFTNTSGTTTINGCTFNNCTAANGGGIYILGTLNFAEESGATIQNCTASATGGAIFTTGTSATVNIKGGTISGNEAKGWGGGAIRVENGSTNDNFSNLTISGGTISGNYTSGAGEKYGGAINIKKGVATISGGTIKENYVTSSDKAARGGAINVSGQTGKTDEGSKLIISGGTISDNYTNTPQSTYGGAISLRGVNASMSMTGGTISDNTATSTGTNKDVFGGAIAIIENSTLTLSGGIIKDNEVSAGTPSRAKGAGIYLPEGSKLNIFGSPNFGGADTKNADETYTFTEGVGNRLTTSLTDKKNGGQNYPNARQDIYIAGYSGEANDVTSLVVNGNLSGETGSIWVWAEENPHYIKDKQFAKIQLAEGESSFGNLSVFRDARPDVDGSITTGATSSPLYGVPDPSNPTTRVIWGTIGGADVSFKKVDGFGSGLGGAQFTLYKSLAGAQDPSNAAAEDIVPITGDQGRVTNNVAISAATADSTAGIEIGDVDFRAPVGIWYMRETTAPTGYQTNDNIYIVLVGSGNVSVPAPRAEAWAGVLEKITQDNINSQLGTLDTSTGKYERDYAVFLIDRTTNKAVTTPDIAASGIVNYQNIERMVILDKINKSTRATISGAAFDVLSVDHSVKMTGLTSGTDISGTQTGGAFYVGMLPLGKYYLHETTKLTGYTESSGTGADGTWWWTLEINKDGTITLTGPVATEPN